MSGELQIRVGKNLRAHRQRMGLSQEAFAYEIDVHRTFMGGLERGERNITLRTLERIAGQLGVDPSVLLAPLESPEESGADGSAADPGAGGARWPA